MNNVQLNEMSISELRDLNQRIISIIKLKQQVQGVMNLDNLELGMTVKYVGSTNKIKNETFEIIKFKKVNVLCRSNMTGEMWNIKPANLKEYKEIDLDLLQHIKSEPNGEIYEN